MTTEWSPSSWQSRPAAQLVDYPDQAELERALAKLGQLPPIVTSWEVQKLKRQLAGAGRGEWFLLQGGDCSERFADCRSEIIDAQLKILLAMSLVLVHGGRRRVVRVGRIAGQYAKPRSQPVETRDGTTLPVYRGDLVNRAEFTAEARTPDASRLLEGYFRSAATINFIRSLLAGGFADVHHPEVWDLSWVDHADKPEEYRKIIEDLGESVGFLETVVGRRLDELASVDFFTSHEGLHLGYEQALSEIPPLRTAWYNLGTHFPWIGDRTRDIDGAHVEFFRGIANPIGLKIGPEADPAELVELARILNPANEPGRLTVIHRLGAGRVEALLPPLVAGVRDAGLEVTWCCDPMHANTFVAPNGYKTRRFDHILAEVDAAFDVHDGSGTVLGGLHVELTGDEVTEVIGGVDGPSVGDLGRAYATDIDPRLNYCQSLQLAFHVAKRLRASRG